MPKLKRRYLWKLKKLGYYYDRDFKSYIKKDEDITHMVDKKGNYQAWKGEQILMEMTFDGITYQNVKTYRAIPIELEPNFPEEWMR